MTKPTYDFAVLGDAVVSKHGAKRVNAGHPWIFRNDVIECIRNAGIVSVRCGRDKLGYALHSPESGIALRMISRHQVPSRQTFRQLLDAALQQRRRAWPQGNAYRIVHGEADFLPGIFVDRYDDCVAIQTTCAGAEVLEPEVVAWCEDALQPRAIVLRDDTGMRAAENLRRHVTVVKGAAPIRARYNEGSVELEVDLVEDQKTGGFLDQTENHVTAARYAFGEGLDCFTYHGGFALQLAKSCDSVIACDQSSQALGRAADNARRNQIENIEFVQADVFDLLDTYAEKKRRFDTIVVDPPAFASGRETVQKALRAYKQINIKAMKMLRSGGVLVSCSCSGRVSIAQFDDMLQASAVDSGRRVKVLERRAAPSDHPVLPGVPETDYLKCRIMTVV